MNKELLIVLTLFSIASCFSQSVEKETHYSVRAQYTQEFVLGGYVRVREWELQGDKMKLKDLGMTSYSALQFQIEKHLRKSRRIKLVYDRYFMHGTATFDRDIAYNGTIINGRNGIDVSPTRYYRLSTIYSGSLFDKENVNLRYMGALVLDHIVFYLDGEVPAYSPKNEVYEGFGRQAFPYPVIGIQGRINFGQLNSIQAEVSGTYIPQFKSFYTEGGRIYLQYSNFQTDVSYSRSVANFEVAAGAKLRCMHIFQESREDTNVITTNTAGPYITVAYCFK